MLSRSTTFDRRQRVLKLLHEQPGVRVAELAQILAVSQGTVRNDLNALAESGQLARVRGGAVPTDDHPGQSSTFMDRLTAHQAAKQRIARWAADLVEDGDSILLDASTTVYHIASHLRDRRNLTIVTNGIEVGRKLAQNSSHTVMLLGGLLRPDGIPVTELLSEHVLRDLHIKTAFVSCAGFTPEAGLTEADIHEAQLKSTMISAAGAVVGLVDASKFGQVDLAPFAHADQVARVFTDSNLDPAWVERMRRTCTTLTVCDENGASDITPCARETRHYRIGFANLGEQVPFAVDVRRGLERAAQEAGNVDLVLADNQLSGTAALQVAHRLVDREVDLAIEYQIDVGAADLIMSSFRRSGVPVIAVDIPMVGATFFGVDNYHAGSLAGVALGEWLHAHWEGRFDRLIMLEERRAGTLPAARMRGQLEGFQSILGPVPEDCVILLDSGNEAAISQAHVEETLRSLPAGYRIAVLSFNDDAAVGAIRAARSLGRERQLAVVGQGADRLARTEMRRPGSQLIGSTAYFPEHYGKQLLELADKILRQEPVPPAVYVNHTFITPGNVDQYYPES